MLVSQHYLLGSGAENLDDLGIISGLSVTPPAIRELR